MSKMHYEDVYATFRAAAEDIFCAYIKGENTAEFKPLREVCEDWFDGHEFELVCTLEILDTPAEDEKPEWRFKGEYWKIGAYRMAEYLDAMYNIYARQGVIF